MTNGYQETSLWRGQGYIFRRGERHITSEQWGVSCTKTGKIMFQAEKKKKSRCQDSKVEKLKRAAIDRILSSQKLYV